MGAVGKGEIERYCRQLILPGFGVQGQERLGAAAVLIVGAGGLGCPAGLYLAAAGVGRLGVVDYDVVEASNLHRQVAHSELRIGASKAASLAQTLRELNSGVTVEEHCVLLDSNNALGIIHGYDVVVDATDNVVTRYLLNDCCVLLDKPLVSGAALRTDGQLTTYHYGGAPCYRCVHPVPPPAETVANCDMGGVLGPVPGMIGTLQALEVLKILALHAPNYAGRMLVYCGENGSFRTVTLRGRRSDCAVCGDDPSIVQPIDYPAFCASLPSDKGRSLSLLGDADRVSAGELWEAIGRGSFGVLIDVRHRAHSDIASLPLAARTRRRHGQPVGIPIDELEGRIAEVRALAGDPAQPVYCICRRGNDSQRAVLILRRHGIAARDVAGGLHEYSRVVDPHFPVY